MKKKLFLCIAAALPLLSACGSTNYSRSIPEGYVKTFHGRTNSAFASQVVTCIRDKLRPEFPATSIKQETNQMFSGKVPSDDPEHPLATFEVDEWGDNGFASAPNPTLTLYQREPVNERITELVNECK